MNKIDLYNELLLSGIKIKAYSPLARKLILINMLLYISAVLLCFFTIYNVFIASNLYLGVVDGVALVGIIYAYFDIRISKTLKRASIVATVNMFVFMSMLVYIFQGKDFTLIWTVFLPLFAIFINGSRAGLIISTLFYMIIFTLAYTGLGEWQDGMWNKESFSRLIAASIGLTLITYFFEKSLENAYEALSENRNIEQQYMHKLEITAVTDPLTKLFNRRHLLEHFDIKFNHAKENRTYFVMFILDLDHFKEYNDTYGHIAGDEALKAIAQVLQNGMRREADSTFRLGGEEFCGLFITNEMSKVNTTIENIRESIELLNIEHEEAKENTLTASFGVCVINEYKTKSFDKMYKIADDALYKAKECGRNCVIGADVISTL
ncbi:diguanylate cyclase [Sulfurimonas aquatica]|uniref:diguanylate cyclase n=1 Tax=Sulfurimonas aquatica TaxID=2672570 RepID=A0A975AZV5_9BACT|nr:diguanylate cyclase [Sulfurimonas aquatica]QSZ41538.1 diguanylate cyclase [Sulfurimonas aquatica]